eukprot:gi/632950398/ref/XP_007890694.1/ PREDICTED: uncharacterized protein C2orf73 homolog [Callorhinchus milii]
MVGALQDKNRGQEAFLQRVVKTWNQPPKAVEVESTGVFKGNIELFRWILKIEFFRMVFEVILKTACVKIRLPLAELPPSYPPNGLLPCFPQVNPEEPQSMPNIFRERISFIHQYDARTWPNEPIRGRRHGAFVQTEINPRHGKIAPRGETAFLITGGSHTLKQLKAERGNLGESKLASPKPSSLNSQQMLSPGICLSKPDLEEVAKAYRSNPTEGQNCLGSQAGKIPVDFTKGQEVSLDPTSTTITKTRGASVTIYTPLLPPATAISLPSQTTWPLIPDISNGVKPDLTPVST